MRRRFNLTPWILAAPVLLAMLFLIFVPSGRLLLLSFDNPDSDQVGFSLANYIDFARSSVSLQAMWRTIRICLYTTALSILAGYPVAYFMAKTRTRWRPLLLAIIVFPLLTSVVVRAYGWTVIMGRTGVVNLLLEELGLIDRPLSLIGSDVAIVVGVFHFVMPFMILSLTGVIQKIDPALEEAAYSLGANPLTVFVRIVLPLSVPGLISGALLVVSLSITVFAIPLLLGGGRTPVLTTLLYQYALFSFDWFKAATVSMVLMIIGITLIIGNRRLAAGGLRRLE
jgi:putative spermidine/putrescine transport system permease protein